MNYKSLDRLENTGFDMSEVLRFFIAFGDLTKDVREFHNDLHL